MERVSARVGDPRFLIADDHGVFAEALPVYLEKTYTVVGVVLDGRAMVAEAMRLRPDAIVVDISLPLLNGLNAARRIKVQAPSIKLIFLTMHDDPNLAAAALELGPVAFVLKHSGGQELQKAIENVLHGKPYVTPKMRSEDWAEVNARARQYQRNYLLTSKKLSSC
jgi:DNA-binding NarL/FixJ family response regulator